MKSIVLAVAAVLALSISAATADYTLVCATPGGGYRDVPVRGAAGLADACAAVANDPRYQGCFGEHGQCPLKGASAKKANLTIITRDVRAPTDARYRDLELGGKVKAFKGMSQCPGYGGNWDNAPISYQVDAGGEYTLCFAGPTKQSDPQNPNCIYSPIVGITIPPIQVPADLVYTGFYACQ